MGKKIISNKTGISVINELAALAPPSDIYQPEGFHSPSPPFLNISSDAGAVISLACSDSRLLKIDSKESCRSTSNQPFHNNSGKLNGIRWILKQCTRTYTRLISMVDSEGLSHSIYLSGSEQDEGPRQITRSNSTDPSRWHLENDFHNDHIREHYKFYRMLLVMLKGCLDSLWNTEQLPNAITFGSSGVTRNSPILQSSYSCRL